jgi:AAA+ superfamily predicted ATPase
MVLQMATAEVVRRMVIAHRDGNVTEFNSAVQDYIAEERRLNHPVVASELERILGTGGERKPQDLRSLPDAPELPRDRERGVVLVELREPTRALDSLVLKTDAAAALARLILENREADLLAGHGLKPMRRVLFSGPPGCGKTAAAESIAKILYLPLAIVRFDAVVSSYLGETAANLRKVFEYARSRPMVMLFDEFDAIGKARTDETEHGELKRVVNSFLQLLDAFYGPSLMIAATNHQQLLDSAIWRRFDEVVHFELPDCQAILELLKRSFHQFPVAPSVSLTATAKHLKGLSFADVERITMDSIKSSILAHESHVTDAVLQHAIGRQFQRVGPIATCPRRKQIKK